MVHLVSVATDQEVAKPSDLTHVKFEPTPDEDEGFDSIHAAVYGSRYAAQDIPRFEMPDHEMPREIAYRMIK
jgi:glutamate decarboxylase